MATYDLEERTFLYGKECALFVKSLSKNMLSTEYGKQLIRSSSSVGANYIEANESLGEKDFKMRIKICRKEAKESSYWLRMIRETGLAENTKQINNLIQESFELRKIFTAILVNRKFS